MDMSAAWQWTIGGQLCVATHTISQSHCIYTVFDEFWGGHGGTWGGQSADNLWTIGGQLVDNRSSIGGQISNLGGQSVDNSTDVHPSCISRLNHAFASIRR